jgi:hypothetical protein
VFAEPRRIAIGDTSEVDIRIDVSPYQIEQMGTTIKEGIAARSAGRAGSVRVASQSLQEEVN